MGTMTIDMLADETDQYWKKYSWILQRKNGKKWTEVQKGTLDKNSTYNMWTDIELCKNKCYRILFKDKQGDGMCCSKGEGWYTVTINDFMVEWSHWLHGKQRVIDLGCSPSVNPDQ